MNLKTKIRLIDEKDLEDLVQLSLLAWAPVFESFQQILAQEIYASIWPDWETSQSEAVETICGKLDDNRRVWVAEVEEAVVGFLACELNPQTHVGEILLLAVHPDYQDQGIGTELNHVALREMKRNGMVIAKVETGGDPSHAPARRSYEKAGFAALPLVRYYQVL